MSNSIEEYQENNQMLVAPTKDYGKSASLQKIVKAVLEMKRLLSVAIEESQDLILGTSKDRNFPEQIPVAEDQKDVDRGLIVGYCCFQNTSFCASFRPPKIIGGLIDCDDCHHEGAYGGNQADCLLNGHQVCCSGSASVVDAEA